MSRLSNLLAYSILFLIGLHFFCTQGLERTTIEGNIIPIEKDQLAGIEPVLDSVIETYRYTVDFSNDTDGKKAASYTTKIFKKQQF